MKRIRRTIAGLAALAVLGAGAWSGAALAQSSSPSAGASASASAANQPITFTYADVSEPSGLNPMVGYLGTDYTFWAMNYDLPINFSTSDFSPDMQHSITLSVDTST